MNIKHFQLLLQEEVFVLHLPSLIKWAISRTHKGVQIQHNQSKRKPSTYWAVFTTVGNGSTTFIGFSEDFAFPTMQSG